MSEILDDLEFVKEGKIIISRVILLEKNNGEEEEHYYTIDERSALVTLHEYIEGFYNERLSTILYKEGGEIGIEEKIIGILMPGTEIHYYANKSFSAELDRCDEIGSFPAISSISLKNGGILQMDYCYDCLIPFNESINFYFSFVFLLRNIHLDILQVKNYLNYFFNHHGQFFLDFLDNNIQLYGKFYPNEAFVNLLKKWLVRKYEQTRKNEPSQDTNLIERLNAVPLGYMFLLFADFIKNNSKGGDKSNLIRMLHAIEGSKFTKLTNSKFYEVIYKGLDNKSDDEQRKALNKIKVRLEKYDLKTIVEIVENELKQIPD